VRLQPRHASLNRRRPAQAAPAAWRCWRRRAGPRRGCELATLLGIAGRPLGRQIPRSLSSTPLRPLTFSHMCAACSTDVTGRENCERSHARSTPVVRRRIAASGPAGPSKFDWATPCGWPSCPEPVGEFELKVLGINLQDASCGKAAGAPSRRRHYPSSRSARAHGRAALTVAATSRTTAPRHRRAPPSKSHVLGPCRFDGTLGAYGP
jgi:hypothetical protein